MSAPVNPPTAPPTPIPAKAAMMGPAAINGPTPGIASEPMPASKPRVPPRSAPAPAPAAAPSGAFVAFSAPMSFEPESFRKKNRNIGDWEAGPREQIRGPFHTLSRRVNPENRCFFACHAHFSFIFNVYSEVMRYDLGGTIVISLVTLPSPAMAVAFSSTASFSSLVRTGPFRVTFPSCAIILTLWA